MIGGKWTTYRKMGEDMIDRVEKECNWTHKNSVTSNLPIHGHDGLSDQTDPFYFYGSDAIQVKKLIGESPGALISKKLNLFAAQVIWAVRAEMARSVEDVLSRRTRCLLLDAHESIRIAGEVASVMAAELNQTREWQLDQVEKFRDLAENYVMNA